MSTIKTLLNELKYKERLNELEDQINEKTIEHIKLLKDDYANAIDKILNTLEKELTSGSSLSDMEEEWDRTKAKADKYYDTVEGLYQIQTLSNKLTQDINKASLSGQKELQKAHDREIAFLREKKNLTEYDVKAAEARYQITLKEIALQEAQQAKNSMKLVRDANGNWTYQYVANQDDIKAKEQDLLDAYNNLYNLANDAYRSNIDSLLALNKDYLAAAKEIALDGSLTDEERVIKLEKLRDRYLEDYKILVAENKQYTDDLSIAYGTALASIVQQNTDNLSNLTDIEQKFIISINDEGLADFNALKQWFDTELSPDAGEDSLKAKMVKLMQQGYEGWNAEIAKMTDPTYAGSTVNAISKSIKDINDVIGKKNLELNKLSILVDNPVISNEEAIRTAYNTLDQDIKDIGFNITATLPTIKLDLSEEQKKLNDLAGEWNGVANEAQSAINKYSAFAGLTNPPPKNLAINLYYNDETLIPPNLPTLTQYVNLVYTGEEPDTTPTIGQKDLPLLTPSASDRGQLEIFDEDGNLQIDPNANKPTDSKPRCKYVITSSPNGQPAGPGAVWMKDVTTGKVIAVTALDWETKYKFETYDTGGYTGDWGNSSGRLAVLHKKELILNQSDTANILSAVSAIRSISGLNNSINEAMMQGISRMMLEMTGMKANANYNTQSSQSIGDTIYEIHAEFPDANDVNSIREAILSLPNLASQRVLKY